MLEDGPIWKSQENLRILLADCPSFRAWAGADSPHTARARIYHNGLPSPSDGESFTVAELQALRPYAYVDTGGQRGYEMQKIGVGTFEDSGSLIVRFAEDLAAGSDDGPNSEATQAWVKTLGRMFEEIVNLAGTTNGGETYLNVTEVRIEDGPYVAGPGEQAGQGDWLGFDIGVSWG